MTGTVEESLIIEITSNNNPIEKEIKKVKSDIQELESAIKLLKEDKYETLG